MYKNTMTYIAKEIVEEQKDDAERAAKGSWHDEFATLEFFKKVCRLIGNLKYKEIESLISSLKEKDVKAVERHQNPGEFWQFSYEKMYGTLMEHPICKKVCEKNKYKCWEDLISRYCVMDY